MEGKSFTDGHTTVNIRVQALVSRLLTPRPLCFLPTSAMPVLV